MKEPGRKTGVLVGLDLTLAGGRTLIPTSGQLSESEEKHLRLRVKQLICSKLKGMRIRVLAAAIHTLDRDAGPLEDAVAESWS